MSVSHMALAYSLEKLIEELAGIPTHIKFDGFVLPTEKPFAVIEFRQNNNSQLSKQREAIQTTFRYQFGIFAESAWKLSEYQETLRNIFLYEGVPLYDAEGNLTDAIFQFEPDFNEVPINADDLTDHTNRHRMYFDLEVQHVFNRRRNS